MQIDRISRITPPTTAWAATQAQITPARTSSSNRSNPAADTLNTSVQIQTSTRTDQAATLASSSTTVGGKNYSESIEELGGTYIASVPNPPAVSASGSSIQSAEVNLNIILDTLA